MEKEIKLLNYKDEEKRLIIKDFENVKELIFEIISGDGILKVVYNDNHTQTFDSGNNRTIDFHDGLWIISPKDIDIINKMKNHYDTDKLDEVVPDKGVDLIVADQPFQIDGLHKDTGILKGRKTTMTLTHLMRWRFKTMTEKTHEKIYKKMQMLNTRDQVICSFCIGNEITSICIDIEENESIGFCFEKGCVIVRTENEVKFVCKQKAFISLWRLNK